MEDQREQRATDKGRYAERKRRALLMLGGIGLLLLVLASAHVCTDDGHDLDAGDYWGYAATGAWDSDSDEGGCTPECNVVEAYIEGNETCNLISQTDFDDWAITIGATDIAPAIAAGRGGWNTNIVECFIEHRLWWDILHAWSEIHGQSDQRFRFHCYDLIPDNGLLGCPY